jgi:ferredoxin-type protein NapG
MTENKDKESEKIVDRRNFFRLGAHKVAKAVVEAKIGNRASRFIRPPFAIDEVDFLDKCTRCHDCVEACPHQTIFPLSDRLDADIASTPALDLVNGACHLCSDWPCVAACEPEALKIHALMSEQENMEPLPVKLPRLSQVHIEPGLCLPYSGPECGACGSVCPVPGAILWDMTKPQINMEICTGCALCRDICVTDPKAITITSIDHSQQTQ